MNNLKTPILFIVFNRPSTTREVFDAIRLAKPSKLFLAADGPRENKIGEKEKCMETRKIIIDNIDWKCEVRTLFREHNLGCGKAVSEAINWFFENVEEGIILEDDCLPHPSFFEYCENLLEKFRLNEKIFMISGHNALPKSFKLKESYYFSRIAHIWGWATWKRAWQKYDFNMQDFLLFIRNEKIKEVWQNKDMQKYWLDKFMEVYEKKLDTWDYQWVYTIYKNNGFSIAPNFNLVSNIGFGVGGTHTHDKNNISANIPLEQVTFPLKDGMERVYTIGDNYEGKNMLYSKNYIMKKILKSLGLFKFIKKIYILMNKK